MSWLGEDATFAAPLLTQIMDAYDWRCAPQSGAAAGCRLRRAPTKGCIATACCVSWACLRWKSSKPSHYLPETTNAASKATALRHFSFIASTETMRQRARGPFLDYDFASDSNPAKGCWPRRSNEKCPTVDSTWGGGIFLHVCLTVQHCGCWGSCM